MSLGEILALSPGLEAAAQKFRANPADYEGVVFCEEHGCILDAEHALADELDRAGI